LNLELLNFPQGEYKAKNNICFLFAFDVRSLLQVFNRYPMNDSRATVASCLEHERLAFELLEVRTRVQYLSRLRALTGARSGLNWTAASAKPWRSWWITSSSMAAPVEGLGSCGRKSGVALSDTKW